MEQEARSVVPPPVFATPLDVAAGGESAPTWWQPGWHDIARFVGWRWVLLAPALGVVAAFVGAFLWAPLRGVLLIVGAKLLLLVAAVALSLAAYVIRRAVRARTEPFCIFCGYNLTGLPDNYRCPECGRPYTWRLVDEYRKDPLWFAARWKMHTQHPAGATPFAAGSVRRARRAQDGTE
ncbi:MAG: hypothetical protein HY763_17295 [Planctomycetes bacterium]|nr:hypothetical protein [Planctomycetota bacterium]